MQADRPSFGNSFGPWPDASTMAEPPTQEAQANPAARRGFPHDKVRKLWEARIAYARDLNKQCTTDAAEAEAFFKGLDTDKIENGASLEELAQGTRFAGMDWFSDVTKLLSYLHANSPKIRCDPAKDQSMKPTAEATEDLANIAQREKKYLNKTKLVTMKALFANKAYFRQGWDHYRWLPSLHFCHGPVYVDPNYLGEMDAAQWFAEEFLATLDELLADPAISAEAKKELRERKECHQKSRTPTSSEADSVPSGTPRGANREGSRSWDTMPGFTKLTCYRIWSMEGACPGAQEEDQNSAIDDAGMVPSREMFKIPNERSDAESPEPAAFDPMDKGRRVYILLVKDFPKVLKTVEWPMDHYDRDEGPFFELRLTETPSDNDGVSFFHKVRPIFKAKNKIMEFWYEDVKASSRRVILVDKNTILSDDEIEQIGKGEHLQVIPVEGLNGVKVIEFSAANPRHLEIIPALDEMHDKATGVNDILRGMAGDVQKTAREASLLNDQSAAALGYLVDAVEKMHTALARMTVQAIQRWVPRETEWEPCPECGVYEYDEAGNLTFSRGSGEAEESSFAGQTLMGPAAIPCPVCGGSGWDPESVKSGHPLRRGADYWLSAEKAQAWVDHLPLEQIRAEIVVRVDPGSSRRDYKERQFTLIGALYDRLMEFYVHMRAVRPIHAMVKALAYASEVASPDDLIITEEEIAAGFQAQMPPPPPPPPGPDPAVMEKQKQDADAKYADTFLRARSDNVKNRLEARKVDLEERRFLAEEEARALPPPEAPQVDPLQQEAARAKLVADAERLAMEREKHAMAMRKETAEVRAPEAEAAAQESLAAVVAQVGAVAATLEQAAMNITAATQAIAAKAEAPPDPAVLGALQRLEAAATAPKEVVRDASGKVAGIRTVAPAQPEAGG